MIDLLAQPGKNIQALAEAVASRKTHVVHLSHNDLDAVGADAIHRMKHGEIFSIFSSVGAFPAILERVVQQSGRGDLLSITDLGYQNGIDRLLDRARQNGWKIQWRDHHRWEEQEQTRVRDRVDLLHIDTTTCACGIVARDLAPEDPVATEVAKVVCDYDLWKNADPRAAVLARILTRNENRTYVRDRLVEGVFTDAYIEDQFRVAQREMEEDIEQSLRHTRVYTNRYRIAIAPLYGHPSETAAAIREETGSDIEVMVYPSGRFSIRSVPPISHRVAREFRGGGHPNAAGGTFEFSLWDRLLFYILKRNSWQLRLVRVAESME